MRIHEFGPGNVCLAAFVSGSWHGRAPRCLAEPVLWAGHPSWRWALVYLFTS